MYREFGRFGEVKSIKIMYPRTGPETRAPAVPLAPALPEPSTCPGRVLGGLGGTSPA